MHHYQLEIELIDGEHLQGLANGTTISDKKEFLVIEVDHKKQNIQLDHIKQFTALSKSAVFKTIKLI